MTRSCMYSTCTTSQRFGHGSYWFCSQCLYIFFHTADRYCRHQIQAQDFLITQKTKNVLNISDGYFKEPWNKLLFPTCVHTQFWCLQWQTESKVVTGSVYVHYHSPFIFAPFYITHTLKASNMLQLRVSFKTGEEVAAHFIGCLGQVTNSSSSTWKTSTIKEKVTTGNDGLQTRKPTAKNTINNSVTYLTNL